MTQYDLTLRLVRTTICPCGYLLMDTPIGTLYRAISRTICSGTLLCGGCGKHVSVTLIACEDKRNDRAAYLCLDVMEVVKGNHDQNN